MSLLAPLFLLGALAIGVPIVAHLMRRATRERVHFSATQFLEPTPPRLDRRNRIEHPWLLLLRCLAVAALAFGFARPFLREAPTSPTDAAAARHVVVVLDESASMQRSGLWPAAFDRVRAVAEELGAADRLALVTTGRRATVVFGASQWDARPPAERASRLDAVLADRLPGWDGTHLDAGVELALEELDAMGETGPAASSVEIVVVSDFADGARLSGLAGRDWPDRARLRLDAVDAVAETNAALHFLGWTTAPDGTRLARLRLAHDFDAPREYRVSLRATDDARDLAPPLAVTLAPREARALTLALPAGHDGPARADLAGDGEPFDNTVWLVPPAERRFPLPYLGSGDGADPRQSFFYVSRATSGWRDPAMTPVAGPDALAADAPLIIVAAPPDFATSARLRARLEAGASVLVLAHDAALVAAAGALAGESGWTVGPAPERDDALLGDIDFRHPLFASFADPRYSDFTRVRFWQRPAIVTPPGSRSVAAARFDDGSPAVLETPVGRGSLVVWAGAWTPTASQWVLSTKFVPWFQALARRAAGGPPPPTMAEVGDPSAAGLGAPDEALARPGIVALAPAPTPRWLALNVPPAESRSTTIPLDEWEALGAPLSLASNTPDAAAEQAEARAAVRAGSQAAARLEAGQQLWRWLLLATAALLALESLVATRLASRRMQASAAT